MGQNRVLIILLFAVVSASGQEAWQLIWGDDFTGAPNTPPSQRNWTYDLGGGGWEHGELQTYTSSTQNAFLDGNGNLVIRAQAEALGGYTSARLKTQGLFTIAYGKIEARIKTPSGQGLWPAFWMLGAGFPSVGWPQCGEIDIMENIGRERSTVHGSLHGPGYAGTRAVTASYTLPDGRAFSDDFHVFSVVWRPEMLEFLVDGQSYQKVSPTNLPAAAPWVFRSPFFIVLNVAVGGDWPGNPDTTTAFPQTMVVDYVRVYRSATSPIVNPAGVLNAASFSGVLAPGSFATLFGTGLADTTYQSLFDDRQNAFVKAVNDISVRVDGAPAALIYVSPSQINFQVPWSSAVSSAGIEVVVNRGGVLSNQIASSIADTAPGLFRSADGKAILTCQGVPSVLGTECTLWGTGFGSKSVPQSDGAPATAPPYPITQTACTLTIGGIFAYVSYCGAAPGLIIDQLNFVYPAGIPSTEGGVPATLRIGVGVEDVRIVLPGY